MSDALPTEPMADAIDALVAPRSSRTSRFLGTAGAKVLSLGLMSIAAVVSTRVLGPTGRGEYFIFVTIAVTATTVGHVSVEHAQIYLWSHSTDRRLLQANALALGGVIGALAALLAWIFTATHNALPGGYTAASVMTFVAIPFGITTVYLNNLLVLDDRIARLNIGMAVAAALQCVLTVALATSDSLTVTTALAVWSVGIAVPFLFALTGVRPRLRHVAPRLAARAISLGLRYHLGMASLILLYRVDIFLLNTRVSSAKVGVYSVAVILAEMAFLFTDSTAQVSLSRQVSDDLDNTARFTARLIRTNFLLALIIMTGTVLVAPVMVPLVFGNEFAGAAVALIALGPGIVALAITRPVGAYLVRLNRPVSVSSVYFAGLVLNVVLNVLLIPRLGIAGASVASSVAYIAVATLNVSWLVRHARLPVQSLIPSASDVTEPIAALWRRYVRRPVDH